MVPIRAAFPHGLREKTRSLRRNVPRRSVRVSDCPCSNRIEHSGGLYRPKPHRKVISYYQNAHRPFPQLGVGSRPSAREWFENFVHYYYHQRPHQSLDGKTRDDEVLN